MLDKIIYSAIINTDINYIFSDNKGYTVKEKHQIALDYAVKQLKEKFSEVVNEAYLYGSCARGEESFRSDVDIVVFVKDGTDVPTIRRIRSDLCSDDYRIPEADVHVYSGFLSEQDESSCYFINIRKDGKKIYKTKDETDKEVTEEKEQK